MLIGPKKPCAGFYAFIIIANGDIVALSIKKFPNAIDFVAVNIPVLGNLSIIVKLGEFHQLRWSRTLYLCGLAIRKCKTENEYEYEYEN